MKKVIFIVAACVFCVSFCMAQNLRQEAEREKERKELEQQKIQAQKQQQDAAYKNAFASAEKNVEQQRYEQAKQDYKRALDLKPENKSLINKKIAEIDKLIAAEKAAERDRKYQEALTSAQRNIEYQRYELAKEDYLTARGLKPENADYINEQIENIEQFIAEEKDKKEKMLAAQKREQEAAERERQAAERERLYLEAIASAERNAKQGRYEHAKDDYRDARNLKPENAGYVDRKIADLDRPATLYIYHQTPKWTGTINFSTTNTKRYDVYLDNLLVGRTENKWKKIVTVKNVGKKTVSATIEGRKAQVQINFEPGETYYVRASYTAKEVGTGRYTVVNGKSTQVTRTEYTPTLQLMDKNLGKSEYDAIKEKY